MSRVRYWCDWLNMYLYKTDKTYRGMTVYVDVTDSHYELTPEQEARLKVA